MEIHFKLKKDFHSYKAGETFDCYGGLVRGITSGEHTAYFNNKEYFKMVKLPAQHKKAH